MKKKKYDPKYIDRVNTLIHQILSDTKEYDDWTQICFSMQDAVQAAANVWGIDTEEKKDQLAKFIHEMVLQECANIQKFEITFKKKV